MDENVVVGGGSEWSDVCSGVVSNITVEQD